MSNQTNNGHEQIFQPHHVMGLAVPLWVFDIDVSRVVWANDAAMALWHASDRDELYNRDMGADMSSAIEQRLKQYQGEFIATGKEFNEMWTLYPNGEPHTFRVTFRGHKLPDGRMGMLCEAQAEEQQSPERLRSSEALNHIPVSITLYDTNHEPLFANSTAHMTYGSSSLPLRERFCNPVDLDVILEEITGEGHCTLICLMHTPNGDRWHEISARSCIDAVTAKPSYIFSEVDVTELKEQEQKVRYLAHHDTLTGLYNRNYVQLAFPETLARAAKEGRKLAMLLIDLDKFKTINDTLGHMSGDKLLIHVSAALNKLVGDKGLIARLGGDEFVLLLSYSDKGQLNTICSDILTQIAMDCVIGEHRINSGASIGISIFPDHGCNLSTLMKHADLALYDSKDGGRNTFSYFRPSLQRALLQQRSLERDLTLAVQRNEFQMFYQPRVDCKTQEIVSTEALIRWFHPERGLIPPGFFIETLEETSLIHDVGEWMMEQVGRDQRRMAANGFDIPISVNISPKQFECRDFVARSCSALRRADCPTSRIEIEITEGMLMGEGYDAKKTLHQLRDRGFSIAIDDFGTGYSNLAYIQDYPISVLKVDKSFIHMIEDKSPVVNMILSMCRLIGISAVAEGVETMDQLAWLQLNHCNEYQGYLYSRPLPFNELIALFKSPPVLGISADPEFDLLPEVEWA